MSNLGSCNAVTHTEVRGQLINHDERAPKSHIRILTHPDFMQLDTHTNTHLHTHTDEGALKIGRSRCLTTLCNHIKWSLC